MKSHSIPQTEEQLSGYVISMLHKQPGFELVYVDVPHKLADEKKTRGRYPRADGALLFLGPEDKNTPDRTSL